MQVLEPAAQVSIGTLYILDDGNDVAIVRLQGESPDLWIVNRLSGDGGMRHGPAPLAAASGTHGSMDNAPTPPQPRSKAGAFLCRSGGVNKVSGDPIRACSHDYCLNICG